MSIHYDRETLIEGNKLRTQATERPSTFAEYNGAVDVLPPNGGKQRFAGLGGQRAVELMTNPEAAKQTENWMGMYNQSNEGFQFNQAKMLQAQAAAQPQSSTAESKES